ncbi:hypothetical protein [Thermoactinomyces sp. CICC 23799]|uniref:Mom family adenine methylcarbamoylation protein n=1 Tax=Thermoactinomyces TaxID=2023 RepID=UPI0018DDFCA6|nr:hypothetical protein [Thermoactinomyces sp. CICC 23799]MBH8600105.1 hypothetical protein [Thermoactinomyces sp. CICC 23799]
MRIKDMSVELCDVNEIRDFIAKWHYSGGINGVRSRYCFKLLYDGEIIGAAIFGGVAMANVWKKYVSREEDLLELRRLCCIDDTPKNTESYFIGQCLRWLLNNTEVKKVISYADMDYGHEGVIYQATNFEYLGKTSTGRAILFEGKRYHDKAIRTKYKGKLKPFAQRLREALERGDATYTKTKGKHRYLYDLEARRKKKGKGDGYER